MVKSLYSNNGQFGYYGFLYRGFGYINNIGPFEVATVAAEAIRGRKRNTRMCPQNDLIMNSEYNSYIYKEIHIALHVKFSEVHHQSSN